MPSGDHIGGHPNRDIRSRLVALARSLTPPPPEPPGLSIRWYPNLQRHRARKWMLWAGIIFVCAAIVGVLGLVVFVSFIPKPWQSWVFSAAFTPATIGAIFGGIGLQTCRQEPLRIGVSAYGIHQEPSPSSGPQNSMTIAWDEIASASEQEGGSGQVLSIRTQSNRTRFFRIGREGAEAAVDEFEGRRRDLRPSTTATPPPWVTYSAGGGGRQPGSTGYSSSVDLTPLPALATPSPPLPPPSAPPHAPLPPPSQAEWRPNSLRRRYSWLGVGMLVIGAILILSFWRLALDPKTSQFVLYMLLPFFIGIVCIRGASKFPQAVAVSDRGFHGLKGGKLESFGFDRVQSVTSAGMSLELTVQSGRTLKVQALGALEMRQIQEYYQAFRGGGGLPQSDPWLELRVLSGFATRSRH